jgi:hypothetical protein
VTSKIGVALGTPQYMSPEQAEGRHDLIGPASDIYSLGAMLYVLLTGQLPFYGADGGDVLVNVCQGHFPPPRRRRPEVPRPLEAVCLKAMSLRPPDRYASALELAADLEHWLAGEPVSAWPEPWALRARRWLERHRTLVAAGLAGAVAAGVLATVVAIRLTATERDEAQRQRDQAREEYDEAQRQLRAFRAAASARAGEHALAAAEAKSLEEHATMAETRYRVACLYSLCAAAVRADAQLPLARRDELAERYAAAAVALLRQAAATGYFKSPKEIKDLKEEKDLAAVRDRDDFKKLLAEAAGS